MRDALLEKYDLRKMLDSQKLKIIYHMEEKEKQVIVMKTDAIKEERVLIMFKNIGSILEMNPNIETNEYVQTGFPKKEEAVIFAYKVENGKPMICYTNLISKHPTMVIV